MAAYAAALGAIYPGRRIEAAVLYTQTPLLIAMPAELLEAHKPGLMAGRKAWAAEPLPAQQRRLDCRTRSQEHRHGHQDRHRRQLPGGRPRIRHARAGRFLGGLVRPVQDDRARARGDQRRARRAGDDRQDGHHGEPRRSRADRRAVDPADDLYKNGEPVAQKLGAAPKSQLKGWIESVL
jgi:hypothetical protein